MMCVYVCEVFRCIYIYIHTVYILVYRYIYIHIFIRSPKNLPQKILTYFRWDNFCHRSAALKVQAQYQYLQRSCQDQPPFQQSPRSGRATWTTTKKPGPKGCKVESFWWFFGETHCSKFFFGGGAEDRMGLKNIGNAQSSKSFGGWRLLTVSLRYRGSLCTKQHVIETIEVSNWIYAWHLARVIFMNHPMGDWWMRVIRNIALLKMPVGHVDRKKDAFCWEPVMPLHKTHKITTKKNSFHHVSTCVGVSFLQFPNKITHDFPQCSDLPTTTQPDDWGEQKRADAHLERQANLREINKKSPDLCDLILVDGGPVSTSWDLSNRTYINHGRSSGISYQPQPGKRRISEPSRVWLEKLTGKCRRISPGSILLMRGLVQMCWSIFIHFPWKNLGESYQHRFSGSKI